MEPPKFIDACMRTELPSHTRCQRDKTHMHPCRYDLVYLCVYICTLSPDDDFGFPSQAYRKGSCLAPSPELSEQCQKSSRWSCAVRSLIFATSQARISWHRSFGVQVETPNVLRSEASLGGGCGWRSSSISSGHPRSLQTRADAQPQKL